MTRLIPDFILERYARREFTGELHAACLTVDVVGFTQLTERLMRQGKAGAEALAARMSARFTPMIAAVHAQGGFIANYAGDALTAIFPGNDSAPRALAAAWQIGQHLADPPAGLPHGEAFPNAARQSLAAGVVRWDIFLPENLPGIPAAYAFTGPPLAACAALTPGPGELWATEDTALQLAGWAQGEQRERGWKLGAPAGAALPAPAALPPPEPRLAALEADFLPPDLRALPWGGEYRPAAAVFIGLRDASNPGSLAAVLQQVFAGLARYGGLLSRVGFDDKGLHLLLLWGAPRTHENDAARALDFLLDLRQQAGDALRAAATFRLTFAGLVGSPQRADYVCYAQGTNLAARMMAAAGWGEIWVDNAIARQAGSGFALRALGERAFKGFDAPQEVFELTARQRGGHAPFFRGELVGREAALAQLAAFAAPLFESPPGSAGVCVVSGEAGIGKSRLVAAFRRQAFAAEPGMLWLDGACDALLGGSLHPLRHALREYFGLSSTADAAAARDVFDARLDELLAALHTPGAAGAANELARTRSLLGALLGIHWPGSLFEQLDARLRFENTLEALIALIRAECHRRPVILALEDAQWLDDDSQKLLAALTRRLEGSPFALLIAIRCADDGSLPPLALHPAARRVAIELGALPLAALSRLADQTLGGAASAELLTLAATRSGGNPFFYEQVLLDLRERGLLAQIRSQWTLAENAASSDLPVTIQAVLLARLDRLSEQVKGIVQAAAVLGREFEVRVLAQMLHAEARLWDWVQQAEQSAIWSALDELRYLFRHALLRDAAYEMQLRARLRALHTLAAQAIEKVYAANLDPLTAELAFHWDKAENYPQAFGWYVRAGERAAGRYANGEAEAHCSRALALAAALQPPPPIFDALALRELTLDRLGRRAQQWADLQAMETVAANDRQRCKVLQRKINRCRVLGEREEEKRWVDALLRQAQALGDPAWLAEAHYTAGLYFTLMDDLAQAQTSLLAALALREQAGDLAGQMDCCCSLALVFLKRWEYWQAMAWIEKARALNEQQPGLEPLMFLLRSAASAAMVHKDHAASHHYASLLLEQAEKAGDAKRRSGAHLLRGQALCSLFRFEEGLAELERSRQIRVERHDRHGLALVLGELAYQYMTLGDFDAARAYFQQSMAIDQETHYKHGYCTSLLNLSFIALLQEDLPLAKTLYTEGLALTRELGNAHMEAIALGNLGGIELLLGEYESARQYAARGVAMLEQEDQPAEAAILSINLALAAAKMGDAAAAQQYAEKLVAAFPRANEDLNDAQRLLWGAAQVFDALGQVERAAGLLAQAHQVFREKLAKLPDPRMEAAFRGLKYNRQIAAAFEQGFEASAARPAARPPIPAVEQQGDGRHQRGADDKGVEQHADGDGEGKLHQPNQG